MAHRLFAALSAALLLTVLTAVIAPSGCRADIWTAPTYRDYSLAVEAYNRGDFEKARTLLVSSLDDYPDNLLSLYLLGHTLVRLDRPAEALQTFRDAVHIYPNLPDVWSAMGSLQEKMGRPDEAVESYRKVSALEPKNPEWPKRISALELKKGDKKNAEASLKEWMERDPDNDDPVILLADLLTEQNRWEEASGLLIGHYPPRGSVLMATRLAAGYFNRGDYESARKWFAKLSTLEPKSADYPYRLGFIAYKAGDKDKAAEYFSEALGLNPHHYEAAYNLAVIRMEQKRWEEAVELLKKCAAIRPEEKEPYRQLGRIYENILLDPAKAAEYYQRGETNQR